MEYAILVLCIINLGLILFVLFKKQKVDVKVEKDESVLERQIAGNTEIKLKIDEILSHQ